MIALSAIGVLCKTNFIHLLLESTSEQALARVVLYFYRADVLHLAAHYGLGKHAVRVGIMNISKFLKVGSTNTHRWGFVLNKI